MSQFLKTVKELGKKLEKIGKKAKQIADDIASLGFNNTKALLTYLRLNDEENRISLTNLALMLMLYKIFQTEAASITDLTILTVTIFNYGHKRHIKK